jgi:hypothetical protein
MELHPGSRLVVDRVTNSRAYIDVPLRYRLARARLGSVMTLLPIWWIRMLTGKKQFQEEP